MTTTIEQLHRLAFMLANGAIPAGYDVDHACHNRDTSCLAGRACLHRRCINPAHLEAVTRRVNVQRGHGIAPRNAAKTHCKRGHEFTPENIYPRSSGGRECLACIRLQSLRPRGRVA